MALGGIALAGLIWWRNRTRKEAEVGRLIKYSQQGVTTFDTMKKLYKSEVGCFNEGDNNAVMAICRPYIFYWGDKIGEYECGQRLAFLSKCYKKMKQLDQRQIVFTKARTEMDSTEIAKTFESLLRYKPQPDEPEYAEVKRMMIELGPRDGKGLKHLAKATPIEWFAEWESTHYSGYWRGMTLIDKYKAIKRAYEKDFGNRDFKTFSFDHFLSSFSSVLRLHSITKRDIEGKIENRKEYFRKWAAYPIVMEKLEKRIARCKDGKE